MPSTTPLKTTVVRLLKYPLWVLQLFTSAKSFVDNPLIGSQRLNRLGLHRGRVAAASLMCRWRRSRLARKVPVQWREAFDRHGFVAIPNLLPDEEFAGLRSALLSHVAPAREMRQGDAITRRMAVNRAMFAAVPALEKLLARKDVKALFRYVAGFRVEPLHYIQTIVTHTGDTAADPQEMLHSDAFHSSLKAWYFLNDVAPDEAPFTYVPGSHHASTARLDWEQGRSTTPPDQLDRLSARGSLRIRADELPALGLPPAQALAVSANTLVVADTFGFHARGASVRPVSRVEVWSYSRRNPFLPFLGGDVLSLPGLAERRVDWLWALRDRLARHIGQPWQPVGPRTPAD